MTRPRASARAVTFAIAAAVAMPILHAGCGSDERELFVKPADAGLEADAFDERGPEVDPTLGGPCTEDSQCNDNIPCTFDRCDQTLSRCRNTPDDSLCADENYCNGREKCVLRLGCQPGPAVTCQDDNPCTIDKCIEATKGCTHEDRDLDGDGDPDDHCIGKRDCNDIDPNVSSKRAEVCGNFVDDNCNGTVDEPGCVQPANDVCSNALAVTASGTYVLSTLATRKDYPTSCTVKTPASAKDVVVAITVPAAAAGPQDVEVWPTTRAPAQNERNEVAVALQTTCGQSATEIACGHFDPSGTPPTVVSTSARTIARGVAPGSTVYAIVTTQTEGIVDLKVDIRAATPKPANETCAAPEPVVLDTPFTVALIDPAKDLPSDCETSTGELTYSFTLAAESDVRIFGSTLVGDGVPVVTIRDASCTGELRCRKGVTPPAFARRLAAGTHVFTVAGTGAIDASILVKAYTPASDPPLNQDCATAPPITPNVDVLVDLSAQEDAIKNGCFGGALQAAYDLTLTQPSDVLVIGRFPTNESGAVSLNQIGCTKADVLACSNKGPTPQRVSRRNLPAGTYRVAIADELGQTVKLSVLVRPTVAPTNVVGADSCSGVGTIGATGGYFLGDTTGSTADFSAGCDAPGQPIGGAKDQLFKIDVGSKRRVVLDMIGTEFTPILDIRKGPGCPGTEVTSGCYVGFGPNRAFLDMVLDTGSYYVQVDGYNGDRGKWNLDVRVLDPPP